ncbi:MAG: hypothetical protein U1E87_09530 [Alphaproteobacteria bacterium]
MIRVKVTESDKRFTRFCRARRVPTVCAERKGALEGGLGRAGHIGIDLRIAESQQRVEARRGVLRSPLAS